VEYVAGGLYFFERFSERVFLPHYLAIIQGSALNFIAVFPFFAGIFES